MQTSKPAPRAELPAGECPRERWIRIPTSGRCPITGLSRPYFYELIKAGKIKTASLKRPGQLRGPRLVWLPSVLDYIEAHATAATEGGAS